MHDGKESAMAVRNSAWRIQKRRSEEAKWFDVKRKEERRKVCMGEDEAEEEGEKRGQRGKIRSKIKYGREIDGKRGK